VVGGSQSSVTHGVSKNINIHDTTNELHAKQMKHCHTGLGVLFQGYELKLNLKSQHWDCLGQVGPTLFFPWVKSCFPVESKGQETPPGTIFENQ
jgi:hypothetical protein